jgi:alpha-amylase/alpha-mannosidase (GH57 family)
MTINGEPVAEIDIKASHLTIYHARIGEPLSRESDPYEGVKGLDRPIAKLWIVASFGKSSPAIKWPREMAKNFKKETGEDLAKVAKARDVKKQMLEAFPALQRLEQFKGKDIWGKLQFIEAEASSTRCSY